VLGEGTNIVNVDGMNRTFASGELDVVAHRASEPVPAASPEGTTPLTRIDWSGDFVDAETRTSAGFAFGAVQTNALYFADAFRVSVAVGLLFARDRCRTLYAPAPERQTARHTALVEALRIVGVTLQVIAASQPQKRPAQRA
jgi:hypothetical protein